MPASPSIRSITFHRQLLSLRNASGIRASLCLLVLVAANCSPPPVDRPRSDTARASSATPTAAPVAPSTSGSVSRSYPIGSRNALDVQAEVDDGRQPWRLDPVLVARSTLETEGIDASQARFSQSEQGDEPGTGHHRATVRATTGEIAYEVDLLQPARQGPTGIWVVTDIRRAR